MSARARLRAAAAAAAVLAAVLAAGVTVVPAPGHAVNPDEMLSNPALEARAREISKELRCLVCQNQSIDDSDAGLAKDLRIIVRERITAGDSDDQVVEFVVARYGDFVLLRPPLKGSTLALWLGPAVIVVLGLLAVALFFRRRARAAAGPASAPLNADEKRRLEKLLKDGPR